MTFSRYCDKPCNVAECGYDGGDCGFENLNREGVVKTEFYFVVASCGSVAVFL